MVDSPHDTPTTSLIDNKNIKFYNGNGDCCEITFNLF